MVIWRLYASFFLMYKLKNAIVTSESRETTWSFCLCSQNGSKCRTDWNSRKKPWMDPVYHRHLFGTYMSRMFLCIIEMHSCIILFVSQEYIEKMCKNEVTAECIKAYSLLLISICRNVWIHFEQEHYSDAMENLAMYVCWIVVFCNIHIYYADCLFHFKTLQ